MGDSAFAGRAGKLRRSLKEAGLEGAVLVPGPNLRYFTGVNSLLLERPFMLLFPADGTPRLVAPKLEAGPYLECPLDMEVHQWTDSEGWDGAIGAAVKGVRMKGRWGLEGKVPYLFLSRLQRRASPGLADAEPVLQGLREVKDESEMALLRKASALLTEAYEEIPQLLEEGTTELELGRRVTEVIYSKGATRVEDVLVQSGPRAADPHGLPSSKKVRRGEGVIFDISCDYQGYYSDITRTVALGKPKELRDVYEKVLAAERKGIAAAGAGVATGKVDGAARKSLEADGLGRYFIHRTGHGLGLEVHEAPYIVEGGTENLRDGMVFTVEPGAYLRGRLGVRIEDDVAIARGKAEVLTTPPTEFGWWA